jgi:hypothetical protein
MIRSSIYQIELVHVEISDTQILENSAKAPNELGFLLRPDRYGQESLGAGSRVRGLPAQLRGALRLHGENVRPSPATPLVHLDGEGRDPLALASDGLRNIDQRERAASIFRFESLVLPHQGLERLS